MNQIKKCGGIQKRSRILCGGEEEQTYDFAKIYKKILK